MWLRNKFLQKLGGGLGERLAIGVLSQLHLFFLGSHKEKEVVRLIRRVRRQRKCLLTAFECFTVHSLVRAQSDLPGELAEVGVFAGASAKLICEARARKPLHLFDTFDGLPESSDKDGEVYRKKPQLFACSLESVRAYLDNYPEVYYYQGLFPDTAGPVTDKTFSFVHLDVDLYESTLACLEFFYPRMSPGGIMLSHDYTILAGVKDAFDEFFADKPERIIELVTTQCMVFKQ